MKSNQPYKDPILKAINLFLHRKKIRRTYAKFMSPVNAFGNLNYQKYEYIRATYSPKSTIRPIIICISVSNSIVKICFGGYNGYHRRRLQLDLPSIKLDASNPKFFDQFMNAINDIKYYDLQESK